MWMCFGRQQLKTFPFSFPFHHVGWVVEDVDGWIVGWLDGSSSLPAHLNVYTAITEQHTKGEPAALGYDNWMK